MRGMASRPPTTSVPRRMRAHRPRSTRVELAHVAPLTLRVDTWQRLLAVGSLLSVLVVAAGLYVTNEANRRQLDVAMQAQLSDRFNKAVEQLGRHGARNIEVRLGAIYALERLMRNSPVDQPAVVEVLAAFIRVHAALPGVGAPAAAETAPPSLDVRTALAVLGRRNQLHDARDVPTAEGVANGQRTQRSLDLSRTAIRDVDLHGAPLMDVLLREADLRRSDLSDATLFIADLRGADLRKVLLRYADLGAADLAGADLRGADLGGADLWQTDLRGADLTGASGLTSEQLRCALVDSGTRLPAGLSPPATEAATTDAGCAERRVDAARR